MKSCFAASCCRNVNNIALPPTNAYLIESTPLRWKNRPQLLSTLFHIYVFQAVTLIRPVVSTVVTFLLLQNRSNSSVPILFHVLLFILPLHPIVSKTSVLVSKKQAYATRSVTQSTLLSSQYRIAIAQKMLSHSIIEDGSENLVNQPVVENPFQ